MRTLTAFVVAGALLGLAPNAPAGAPRPNAGIDGLRLAGHGDPVNPALRRFTGVVVKLGNPEEGGAIKSIQIEPIGPRMVAPPINELRGWRLTVLSGARFASVFVVQSNTATEITVQAPDTGLEGLTSKDVFVVEEIDTSAPVEPSARTRDVAKPGRG